MASETAVARGRRAEAMSEAYLLTCGYQVVCRNYRAPGGEVDLVAWDAGVLCFIEIRARQSDLFGHPLETIDQAKIRRVVRAAHAFITTVEHPWPDMRFDALGLLLTQPPIFTLVKGAFEA